MAPCAPQSSTFARKFRGFLRWMRDNGIEYTDGLAFELGGSGSVADVGVSAVYPMRENELIATIPKQACLTVKTTAAAELIEEEKLGGGLGLAVALMYERSLQERSTWYGYLQLLPQEQKLPFLWSPAEIDSLLPGTELHKVIKEDRILMEEDWKDCIAPLTVHHASEFPGKWFSFDHYLTAKTLIASRAFEVDEYHGYGMIPLADLFNHKTAAEDVHLTSVDPDSDSDSSADASESQEFSDGNGNMKDGSMCKNFKVETKESDCHHKAEESREVSPSSLEGNNSLLEMILVKDVSEASEIFNTYGTLSNAALLHRYGFTEPDNPFDIVNIDLTLVLDVCLESFSARHIRRRAGQWRKIGFAPCLSQDCEYFEISAVGKPQEDLLMLLFLVHLSDQDFENLSNVKSPNEQGIESIARALGWTNSQSVETQAQCKKRTRQNKGIAGDVRRTDMGSWLMTASVCKSMLAFLQKRDSLYPTSCLADDLALLSRTSCQEQPQLFHAIRLRSSERSILKRCKTNVLQRLAILSSEPQYRTEEIRALSFSDGIEVCITSTTLDSNFKPW